MHYENNLAFLLSKVHSITYKTVTHKEYNTEVVIIPYIYNTHKHNCYYISYLYIYMSVHIPFACDHCIHNVISMPVQNVTGVDNNQNKEHM